MTTEQIKNNIKFSIQAFAPQGGSNLTTNALKLFQSLGYITERQAPFHKKTKEEFAETFISTDRKFDKQKAKFAEWKYVDLLFQLSKEEMLKQTSLFDTKKVDSTVIETYLFFVIDLSNESYSRTELSLITREVNRLFPMPAMILFRHGSTLTLSVINRRLHKRDETKDVLEKVTLIKDINTANPHRAHIEILFDLSFDELKKKFQFTNFVELHNAWQKTLDTKELNKRFFNELSNWYFSAMNEVSFPDDLEKKKEVRNATNLIRLITRVIFIWFIKEKQLVPASLFRKDFVASILKDFNKNKKSQNYYNAVLQNLFFGTLNQKMEERKFAKEGDIRTNKEEYGVKNLFRYADLFNIPEKEVLALFKDVPFLNGGLFDCLDKPNDDGKIEYVDGFSRNARKQASVPDYIFFGEEKEVDLNEVYGTKNKRYSSRGLINLLESYKFTVAENTPIEEEIALDPELLGKVFENLLASYNPETQTTARKQTGSFYTPREIVNYMVDESLLEYLKGAVSIPADGNKTHSIPADDSDFFNPNDEIQIYQGNLPHWQQEHVWYFVTFRLADSIPAEVAEQIKAEREAWLKKNPNGKEGKYSKEQLKEYNSLFSDRIESLLNDCKGSCILRNREIADIVKKAIEHFNKQRYVLDEWVIMPNHVHVLLKPLSENKLDEILHSWKSFTANEINKALGKKGQVWMHESYDHIVRNEKALHTIRNYIRQNPVKAKLADGEFLISEQVSNRSKDELSLNRSRDEFNLNRSRDASDTFETRLRDVFSYSENPNPFSEAETKDLIEAINKAKILDPACGSGAFPMGILHKMVHILQKLDPDNKHWKELQRKKAIEETEAAFKIGDKEARAKRLAEINDVFENNASDYGRKLYLIENCIYGIDIQPIAVQIAKLRFFISLVVDQKVLSTSQLNDNRGIRPLPNLETKFVAANTLIGLDKPQQTLLRNPDIEVKENELKELRHKYFTANTRKVKIALQKQDKKLRLEIAKMLENDGWETKVAKQIVAFDPYDQNQSSGWFDPEWMFGMTNGFNIVIGNPPYGHTISENKEYFIKKYVSAEGKHEIFKYFIEKGLNLLRKNGTLTYITSDTWTSLGYFKKLRKLIYTEYRLKAVSKSLYNVFETATVDTNIYFIEKSKPSAKYFLIDGDLSKRDERIFEMMS